jgi:hypothetical protein
MNNLCDIKNYNKTFETHDIKIYIKHYIDLVNEYMVFSVDNMSIQNEEYLLFLIKRGIETLMHCFKTLLMYTKNLQLTMFHCKKALYYYIEFIGQIGDITMQHSYLQLNSKDAILFVYKKTIYDIDNSYRQSFILTDKEPLFLSNMSNYMILFNDSLLFILQNDSLKHTEKKNTIYFAIKKATRVINKIVKKDSDTSDKICKYSLFFLQIIQTHPIDTIKYSNICEIFINKLHKYSLKNDLNDVDAKLKEKLYIGTFEKNLLELSPLRFINWLLNPL